MGSWTILDDNTDIETITEDDTLLVVGKTGKVGFKPKVIYSCRYFIIVEETYLLEDPITYIIWKYNHIFAHLDELFLARQYKFYPVNQFPSPRVVNALRGQMRITGSRRTDN